MKRLCRRIMCIGAIVLTFVIGAGIIVFGTGGIAQAYGILAPIKLEIKTQPTDQTVTYPAGAEFLVEVNQDAMVDSFQWYCRSAHDESAEVFELDGTSAKTAKLIVPSTEQGDTELAYWCVIKDKVGNTVKSDEAILTVNDRDKDTPVVYIGEFAIVPGEYIELDQTMVDHNTPMGEGRVSFAEDGVNIYLDNVRMNNSTVLYDHNLAPSCGFFLMRHNNDVERYNINLTGENVFDNTLGDGMTMNMAFWGKTKVSPTVFIQGDGWLDLTAGYEGIHCEDYSKHDSQLRIDSNFIIRQKEGSTDQAQGMYTDHLQIGKNVKAGIDSRGSAIVSGWSVDIEEGANVHIMTQLPKSTRPETVCSILQTNYLDIIGADISIHGTCIADTFVPDGKKKPAIMKYYGIESTRLNVKDSAIRVSLDAPNGYPDYANNFACIASSMDNGMMVFRSSDIQTLIDSKNIIYRTAGIVCDGEIRCYDTKMGITNWSGDEALGLWSQKDSIFINGSSNVSIDVGSYGGKANTGIYCHACSMDLADKYGATVDVKTEYGVAFALDTGESGLKPKYYDPNYNSQKLILQNDTYILQPTDYQFSTTSYPAGRNYKYYETIYDRKDTSKPAEDATFCTVEQGRNLRYAKIEGIQNRTYNGSAQTQDDLKVTLWGRELTQGKDYRVYYTNNTNAGTAGMELIGVDKYKGSKKGAFTIAKATQPMKVTSANKKLKKSKLKKKAYSYKALKVTNAKGRVSYKIKYKNGKSKKAIRFDAKTGKIKVKKNTKKGTYQVTVKVTAAGDGNYGSNTISKTIKVKVK